MERDTNMMHVTYSTRTLPASQYRSRATLREGEVKLEPDLLRELLLHIEEHATEVHDDLDLIELPGWTDKQVTYHVVRASEAGLVDATVDKLPDDENPELVHVVYSIGQDRATANVLFKDAVAMCRANIPGAEEDETDSLESRGEVIIRGEGDNAWKVESPRQVANSSRWRMANRYLVRALSWWRRTRSTNSRTTIRSRRGSAQSPRCLAMR